MRECSSNISTSYCILFQTETPSVSLSSFDDLYIPFKNKLLEILSSQSQSVLLTTCDESKSWISTTSSSSFSQIPNSFNFLESQINELSLRFHSLLDSLPSNKRIFLNVIWISSFSPSEDSPVLFKLFEVLKRSVLWHDALFLLALPESTLHSHLSHSVWKSLGSIVLSFNAWKELAEVFSSELRWRGSLGFWSPKQGHFLSSLFGFELHQSGEEEEDQNEKDQKDKIQSSFSFSQSSQTLQVMSKVNINTIPKVYFTNESYVLRCITNSRKNEAFLRSTENFSDGVNGLICRLELVTDSASDSQNKTTKTWRKGLSEGTLRDSSKTELTARNVESIYLLVYNSPLSTSSTFHSFLTKSEIISKMAVVLKPPSYFQLSHFQKYTNIPFFSSQQEKNVDSELLNFDGQFSGTQENGRPENHDQKRIYSGNKQKFGNKEEKRFLKAFSISPKKRNNNDIMVGSSNSQEPVLLEAKELVKFFSSNALALKMNEETEYLKGSSKGQLYHGTHEEEEKELSTCFWENTLRSTALGIDYNEGEDSEAKDRDFVKIQKIYVGSRETASTCHSQNNHNKPDVILNTIKSSNKSSNQPCTIASRKDIGPGKHLTKTISRHKVEVGSRESESSASDNFTKKLRNAVFNALSSRNMDVEHKLFLPSFKKLFEITKLYAGSKPASSTKAWLYNVAMQNVDVVIHLEKALYK